jgi:hypothetical protein
VRRRGDRADSGHTSADMVTTEKLARSPRSNAASHHINQNRVHIGNVMHEYECALFIGPRFRHSRERPYRAACCQASDIWSCTIRDLVDHRSSPNNGLQVPPRVYCCTRESGLVSFHLSVSIACPLLNGLEVGQLETDLWPFPVSLTRPSDIAVSYEGRAWAGCL